MVYRDPPNLSVRYAKGFDDVLYCVGCPNGVLEVRVAVLGRQEVVEFTMKTEMYTGARQKRITTVKRSTPLRCALSLRRSRLCSRIQWSRNPLPLYGMQSSRLPDDRPDF
jgi:hypothetical protein